MNALLLVSGLSLLIPGQAFATSITANLTVDDSFTLFISTNDAVAGTSVCSGASHLVTNTCSFTLTPGVANYIHVQGNDLFAVISAFIGTFTLNDTLFQFGNGTQTLSTNTVNWAARVGSFAGANLTPLSYGTNGVGPWGTRPGIASGAQWLWESSGDLCVQCTRYFSAAITPAAVPEASTLVLLGLGLAGLAGTSRRRFTR